MKPLGCPTEVELLGDREEGSHLSDIHRLRVSPDWLFSIGQITIAQSIVVIMYTGNPEVPDDVFADVLKQITEFVRERVVPRELEILATDAIPDDLRRQAAEMGLFGYAIPEKWGGLGLDRIRALRRRCSIQCSSPRCCW